MRHTIPAAFAALFLALGAASAAAQGSAVFGGPQLPPTTPDTEAGGQLNVGGPDSLTTLFAWSSGARGNMFDIEPSVNLRLTALDLNLNPASTTFAVDVYYRPVTSFGAESSSAGWVLFASGSGTSAAQNAPSHVVLQGADFMFKAGQSYGIYVDVSNYPGHQILYSGGASSFTNEDLRLTTNCAKGSPLFTGTTFTPRQWNGTLYYETFPTLNVALAASPSSAAWNDEIRAKLEATGRFNSVDLIDVVSSSPTLADLLAYDSVLMFTDRSPLDKVAFGDALADYVDAGGGVVSAVFSNTGSGLALGGRWLSGGYEVILSGSGQTQGGGPYTLGALNQPTHSVLQGVSSFSGGSSSYRPTTTTLASGARSIAEWSDGRVLIAEGARSTRIGLGFYPPSSTSRGDFWDANSDGDRIMANALAYVARPLPKVALVTADGTWVTDPQAKLLATGRFAAVDLVDARNATPSLATLQQYDAIAIWSNGSFQDPVVLGDNVADYVDAGGGVVLATFATSHTGALQLQGRFLSGGYQVIVNAGVTTGAATLGAVSQPTHPVMAGVGSFAGGSSSYRPTGALSGGSTLIASWNTGQVLAAAGANPRRIDLGFFPISSDSRADFWDASTDGTLLLANALTATAKADGAPCTSMSTYCTAGTTSSGCRASISAAGTPSATASSGFTITVDAMEGNKSGIVFYGISGPKITPWGGGSSSFLCVKAPVQRMTLLNSGGTAGQCDGSMSIDWNAWVSAHPGKLGAPFEAGCGVWAQGWFRDPGSPRTTSLSDALQFVTCP